MWRRQPHEPDGWTDALVAECEAILSGRGAELVRDRGGAVPVWGWINLLAHGTEDDLRAAVRDRPDDDWIEARGYLAEEIIRLVDAELTTLDALQRNVLVPLELEAMREERTSLVRPAQVVVQVLAAIDEARTNRYR